MSFEGENKRSNGLGPFLRDSSLIKQGNILLKTHLWHQLADNLVSVGCYLVGSSEHLKTGAKIWLYILYSGQVPI
jgi:hypothetical protein